MAPELLLAEVGNILWKKHRLGELTVDDAGGIMDDLCRMPLQLVQMSPYIENALAIAIQYKRTVYDSIYLALAIHHGSQFVTADTKLVNALVDTQLTNKILHIENVS